MMLEQEGRWIFDAKRCCMTPNQKWQLRVCYPLFMHFRSLSGLSYDEQDENAYQMPPMSVGGI